MAAVLVKCNKLVTWLGIAREILQVVPSFHIKPGQFAVFLVEGLEGVWLDCTTNPFGAGQTLRFILKSCLNREYELYNWNLEVLEVL